jgi:hypothetical protein
MEKDKITQFTLTDTKFHATKIWIWISDSMNTLHCEMKKFTNLPIYNYVNSIWMLPENTSWLSFYNKWGKSWMQTNVLNNLPCNIINLKFIFNFSLYYMPMLHKKIAVLYPVWEIYVPQKMITTGMQMSWTS